MIEIMARLLKSGLRGPRSMVGWGGRGASRPFRAVFNVLTGGDVSGGQVCTMSRARFACKSREMLRTIALTGLAALIAGTTTSLAPPAQAQIGNIFSDPPLRPPGAIPRGNQQAQQTFPARDEEVPELPRGRLLPTPNRPPPGQGAPPPGNFQSQPLPPPPGTTLAPHGTQPGPAAQPPQPGHQGVANAPPGAPLPGLPPGQ